MLGNRADSEIFKEKLLRMLEIVKNTLMMPLKRTKFAMKCYFE